MRKYNSAHDLAIKAANWAMKEDAECATAHWRRMEAKSKVERAPGYVTRQESGEIRDEFEAADGAWRDITKKVFRRVMAEHGFDMSKPPWEE